MKRTAAAIMATVFLFTQVTGCGTAGPRPATPEIILDRSLNDSRRADAIRSIALDGEGTDEALVALHLLAWSDRHPVTLRSQAMDRLIEHDAEAFWRAADRWLVTVDAPGMIKAIGERAIANDREDAIPALLRRWAIPQKAAVEMGRPEAVAFRRLVSPTAIREALWGYVISPDRRAAEAAWMVWFRISNGPAGRQKINGESGDTPLLEDLRAAAAAVDHLPRNREELHRLTALRQDAERWVSWSKLRESVHPRLRGHIALRHLPVLARLDKGHKPFGPMRRASGLQSHLRGSQRFARQRPAGRAVDDVSGGGLSLSAADVAVAHEVVLAMNERTVVSAWFAQADADHADKTTEHGGVLTWDAQGKPTAVAFPPKQKEGDQKYFSPPELIEAMYTGLAHYHFHAQEYENAEFAGPGRGDLEFVDALRTHALTLTFIDRDRLNVDLAFPGGWVLDLGCIERPAD
ncbi:MAG: hypothetical protein AAGH99_12990 [Planctomycetota bacterium]